MSWEEYKKKRESNNIESGNKTSIKDNRDIKENTSIDTVNQSSSWEQYKAKRDQQNTNRNNSSQTNLQNNNLPLDKNKANNSTIAENILNGTGKLIQNTWLGVENGIKTLQQQLGRTITNHLAEQQDVFEEFNKEMLKKRFGEEKSQQITQKQSETPIGKILTGDNIRRGAEENYNEIDKEKEKNTNKIIENAESINNPIAKKLAQDIMPSIGQMLPGMAGGPLGTVYFIGSATGNYYDDAKQRGMTEDEATIYSGIMGTIEGLTEKLGADLTTNVGKNLLKKNIKGALVNYGLDIGENFLEEAIVEPISEITAQTIAGKEKANWENIGTRMIESGIDGAITSLITGGVSGLIGGVASKNAQNQYKDINTNEVLNKDSQKWLKQAENIIKDNNSQNLQQNIINNQNTTNRQQITNQENKMAQNGFMDKSNMSYIYQETNNEKINNLRKDMSKYWNNSDETKNLGNVIEKVISDKGYNVRIDDTITNNKGQTVNAQIKTLDNGEVEIRINPNSKNVGEFLLMHETTHAIETQEMKDLVMDYASKNQEFKQSVESLKQVYGVDDISDEVLADVSGQLFGNQEFINNLSMDKPSIFKRIYNKIIELANKITGNSHEALFIRDLKNKWEEAYRTQNNNLDENIYFSEIYNSDGSFDRVKIEQNIFENSQGKSIKKTIKEYLTQHIGEYYNIIESGQKVYLGEDLPNEYSYSEYSKKLPTNKLLAKGRASSNLQEIIENANNRQWSKNKKIKHAQDAKYGFYKYDTKFSFDVNGKEQIYSGTVLIRNDANGKKYLYDILDIKKVGNNLPPIASNSQKSSANIGGSNSLPNNSILPTKEKVNRNTTKYSMQESENNSDSFNLHIKDNKGRILSKKQQEYFKDSKVRDENGSLLEVYHGTPYEFYKFNYDKLGENTSSLGPGFYFTDKIETAEEYKRNGGNLKEVYLDMKKPLKYGETTITKSEYKKFINAINEETNGTYLEDYDGIENALMEYDYGGDDIDLVNAVHSASGLTYEKTFEILRNTIGYDGIISDKGFLNPDETVYVVFNANQIKNVNNTNPTVNPDIRFSQNNETWKQYLEKNYKATGTRTNLEDVRLKNKAPIGENSVKNLSLLEWLDKKHVDYEVDENNNITSVENENAIKEYYNEMNIEKQQTNSKNTEEQNGIAPIGKNMQTNNISNQVSSNLPLDENRKERKHYKSIIESQYTSDEAKAISKELMGTDTYVPDSNENQLQRANERIQNSTPNSELNSFMSKVMNGEKIEATDIAIGERLIQYYSKIGDKTKLQDAIQATAMAGTSAGQTVQAMSLLNHQTPEGQAIWLQRSVDKMNNELTRKKGGTTVKDNNGNIKIVDKKGNDITKNVETFKLTPEMTEKIVNSKDSEELQKNLNEVYKELGQQVSKTTIQKIDAWRYFAMLANPKTHIRNIVGNTAMSKVQGIKNKVAGTIEGAVSKIKPGMERNHTLVQASKEVKEFAKNDIKNVADRLELNDNKYNPKTRLENSMRIFKSDIMENTVGKLFNLNDNLLEAEDGWGLKAGYTKALAEYMTANKLNPKNITDTQLSKARNFAIEQAKEATFHQSSSIATVLNQFANKNGLTKFAMDSVLPFKKTPINVAKSGLEYSPAGLVKSVIYDTAKLRKGDITINKYIDNISKGLTGTGITLLGYALADAGILKASGSDDKDKESYDEQMGKQTYSISIAGNTYSLDWLAPTGIPLFIGAECHEIMREEKETKTSSSDDNTIYSKAIKSATNILDSFTNAMNPMTEMSMLSGLTSALQSYDGDSSKMLANMGTNAVKSYVNQFVPTAVGQVAKTIDKYERDTTSTKNGTLPRAIDTTKNQIMNKIPGLREKLPIKSNIWGKEMKQSDNIIQRGLENAVFPWTRKNINTTKVDEALSYLYDNTGESSVLPDTINKKITINGQDYRLTNEEYAKYKKEYGKTSYNLIENLISSKEYDKLTDEQKQKAIEQVYSYAKEKNKVDYAKNNKQYLKTSTLYNTLEKLKEKGGSQSDYLNYIGKTSQIEKATEKNEILLNSNYSKQTKSIIYENTTGKEDENYNNIIKKSNIDIDAYLSYKVKKSNNELSADKDKNGKTISGSQKKKVINYINSLDLSIPQKAILIRMEYSSFNNYNSQIVKYVNNLDISKTEKTLILKDLKFKVNNGKVTW